MVWKFMSLIVLKKYIMMNTKKPMIFDDIYTRNIRYDTKTDHALSGVGGWLRLLVLKLMLIGPVIDFFDMGTLFKDASEQYPVFSFSKHWIPYKISMWCIFLTLAALSISAGYRLLRKHHPQSVKYAIWILWITGPIGMTLFILPVLCLVGWSHTFIFLKAILADLLKPTITALIWTFYLKHSVRVKNTYRATSEDKHN